MPLTRRGFALSAIAASGAATLTNASRAAAEPIRIGWLAALTGPLASPSIGFDRGVRWATDEINNKGGVDGRMIELIVRDTPRRHPGQSAGRSTAPRSRSGSRRC